MALFRGKLLAGAVFAGALFAGDVATQPATTISPTAGGGSPYLVFNVAQQPQKTNQKQKLIAMQRAEEEILLAIIMNAVTNNLLDG